MTRLSTPESDSEVPPAVVCARCNSVTCGGCEATRDPHHDALLAWEERDGSVARRLFRTAHSCSAEPARVFGALPDGAVTPALGFALAAETLALASFFVCVVLALLLLAPRLALKLLSVPFAPAYALGALAFSSLAMVALHALWGTCLELGARGASRAGLRQSLRFSLYACGWDLLTSPAGVIEGLLRHGPLRTFASLVAAVRAPRPALRAYQEERRGFERAAQRRALRVSIVVGTLVLLLLLPVLGYALVALAERVFTL